MESRERMFFVNSSSLLEASAPSFWATHLLWCLQRYFTKIYAGLFWWKRGWKEQVGHNCNVRRHSTISTTLHEGKTFPIIFLAFYLNSWLSIKNLSIMIVPPLRYCSLPIFLTLSFLLMEQKHFFKWENRIIEFSLRKKQWKTRLSYKNWEAQKRKEKKTTRRSFSQVKWHLVKNYKKVETPMPKGKQRI